MCDCMDTGLRRVANRVVINDGFIKKHQEHKYAGGGFNTTPSSKIRNWLYLKTFLYLKTGFT